ncbi:MAG: hypothetical protein ACKVWV_02245 [Planctomycetota bacterium]
MHLLAASWLAASLLAATQVQAPRNANADATAPYLLPPGRVASAFEPAFAASAAAFANVPTDLGGAGHAPGYAAGAWHTPATWDAWAQILTAEVGAQAQSPERRARLCLLALEQERFEDAWQHARLSSDAWRAALLPRFLPGVAAGVALARDGSRIALSDGAVLTPSLPPASPNPPPGRVDVRKMRVADVAIGAGRVSLQVSVEHEGVQIEIAHVGGEALRLAVRLPTDERYAYENEYVDWYRQDHVGVAHTLELRPGEEAHVIYGRFTPRALEHPTRLPDVPPAQLARGNLWLRCASEQREVCAAIARSLEQGPLALKTELVAPDGEPKSQSGISFDLTNADERARKTAWLVSSVERLALP